MNLPNADIAHIDQTKIVDYLLDPEHREGVGKARFFVRFGFTVNAWELLANALLDHARIYPVVSLSKTRYGIKYRIDGSLVCPDGRSPSIRSVWIIDSGAAAPRLVTAHPL